MSRGVSDFWLASSVLQLVICSPLSLRLLEIVSRARRVRLIPESLDCDEPGRTSCSTVGFEFVVTVDHEAAPVFRFLQDENDWLDVQPLSPVANSLFIQGVGKLTGNEVLPHWVESWLLDFLAGRVDVELGNEWWEDAILARLKTHDERTQLIEDRTVFSKMAAGD